MTVASICVGNVEKHANILLRSSQGVKVFSDPLSIIGAHSLAYQVRVHRNCVHNQYAALSLRHIKDRTYIKFNPRAWKTASIQAFRYLRERLSDRTVEPVPLFNIAMGYSGAKRKIYLRALEDLRATGFSKMYAKVKMFVKPDKHPLRDIVDKAPRAIQYRRPHFNLLLASYLKPIEHLLYASEFQTGGRIFAKGRNNQQRAADILQLYGMFHDPVVIEADHSKFDSCVRVEHLLSSHKFYMKFHRNKGSLWRLLHYQINNRGRTENLKYKVKGTRMSGDFDTGLGNSLINFVVLWHVVGHLGGKFYIDGDDSLIFVERSRVKEINFAMFEQLGFETKYKITTLIEAEFCQAHLIRCDPPILVRNPRRLISHMQVCLKRFGPRTWPRLLQGKYVCEYHATQGVPYINSWLFHLIDQRINPLIPFEDRERFELVKTHQYGRPTAQAYEDMYVAFGMGVESNCVLYDAAGKVLCVPAFPKCSYVLQSQSVRRAGQGYQSLPCSPDVCSGSGCPCSRQPGSQCYSVVCRPTRPPPTSCAGGSGPS